MKLLPLLLLTAGCADFSTLAASRDALKVAVNDARSRERCAPGELAKAEASLAFAELELKDGDARRALDHLNVGREQVAAAGKCPSKMGTDAGMESLSISSGGAAVVDAPDTVTAKTTAPAKTTPTPTKSTTTPVKTTAPAATTTKTAPIGLADRDADGVTDDDDVCMNDPEDLDGFKDSDGCPELDNDSDGINDAADKCRDAAEDRDGFQDADGCPETDNDADGVPDTKDGCPTQAGLASTNGCPVTDGDSDGLSDDKDKCPTMAETKNGVMDDDGCPDSAPLAPPPTATASVSTPSGALATLSGSQIVISSPVEFEPGQSVMLLSSLKVLDSVVAVMKANPTLSIEIGGHTDNEGDDAKNQSLSKDRADAVWEYMLSKGVEARRMRTVGYGETQPIDTNRTDAGRAHNRRIEFLVK